MLTPLLPLFWLVGWVLGIVGFFRARRALNEVALLRAELARAAALSLPGPAVSPRPAADPFSTPEAPAPVPPEASLPPAEPILVTTAPPATGPEQTAGPSPVDPPQPAQPPWGHPSPEPQRIDVEALLTMRWGVWLGAVALVLAGVFLVRYVAEQGWLGPAPRCGLAALLAVSLIAAAEGVRRWEGLRPGLADQAAPALAASGIAVLFGAAYGIGPLYALVPQPIAFAALAAASLAGLALSLRHGQLVAAIGLVGAFVTPALVQTQAPSLPGLFAYLLFVTAAALAVMRYTAWVWVGWASTVAGAVWVVLAIIGGVGSDAWAPALFVPAAAALTLALLPAEALDHDVGRRLAWVPVAALGLTALLLATLQQDGATRAGVVLLTPLTIAKAATEPRLRLLPYLAASLFLLLLAGWSVALPGWHDMGLSGVQATSTGQALLDTAAFVAGCFAVSGLWFERRSTAPLAWSSLAASVPVLILAVCYARATLFAPRLGWTVAALLLAAGLTAAAAAALREQGRWAASQADARAHAGVHAAGAVAALALGCAMMLREHWLTLALSLLLPMLAWIAAQVDLPALRRVALAMAALVLVRLLLNWYVLDYVFGGLPEAGGLLLGYGVPAIAFALAAAMFRRQADSLTVGVLEAGAAALVTVLAALEIRDAQVGPIGTPVMHFAEATLHVASLAILALVTMHIATRLNRPVLHLAWRVQGALAVVAGALLVLLNPAVTGAFVGHAPLLDWLLPAYALPALLALLALAMPATAQPVWLRRMLAGCAIIGGFAWITLEIRHLFHRTDMAMPAVPVLDAELWAWSGAWLAYGAALMGVGIRLAARRLRLVALAILGLTAAKVFLIDMSGLAGLWRVVSFLGLGLTLIGLGAIYRRFVTITERSR